jgi:uncharacterized membrane protein YkvI
MKSEEAGDQGEEQRPSFLEYAGMGGCTLFCIGSIGSMIGLVSWGITSLLQAQFHLPMWLGVPIGIAVGVLVVFVLQLGDNHTLVELAITCAIITVLIWILIPVFKEAREKGRLRREKQERSAISAVL